jgi:hypothetical protein
MFCNVQSYSYCFFATLYCYVMSNLIFLPLPFSGFCNKVCLDIELAPIREGKPHTSRSCSGECGSVR